MSKLSIAACFREMIPSQRNRDPVTRAQRGEMRRPFSRCLNELQLNGAVGNTCGGGAESDDANQEESVQPARLGRSRLSSRETAVISFMQVHLKFI